MVQIQEQNDKKGSRGIHPHGVQRIFHCAKCAGPEHVDGLLKLSPDLVGLDP